MTRRVLIVAATAAAFAFPAAAQASPSLDAFQSALNVAQDYWHATPACGQVRMSLEATGPISPNGRPATGWVWTRDGHPIECVIHLLDTPQSDWGADPQGFCRAVVHEEGHLLGYGHSPDQHSVMYDKDLWEHAVAGCEPPVVTARARRSRRHR